MGGQISVKGYHAISFGSRQEALQRVIRYTRQDSICWIFAKTRIFTQSVTHQNTSDEYRWRLYDATAFLKGLVIVVVGQIYFMRCQNLKVSWQTLRMAFWKSHATWHVWPPFLPCRITQFFGWNYQDGRKVWRQTPVGGRKSDANVCHTSWCTMGVWERFSCLLGEHASPVTIDTKLE